MVGQTTDDIPPKPFAGDVIFEVVGIDTGKPLGLDQTLAAIRGHGTTDASGSPSPLAIGVWGMGGEYAGTGVLGQGGVGPGPSRGGVGVHGQGGQGDSLFSIDPGIGVLGEGGTSAGPGNPNGPGVVGVAGGTGVPISTGGAGVFGISQNFEGVRGEGNTGVFGTTSIPDNRGVIGYSSAPHGNGVGVEGICASQDTGHNASAAGVQGTCHTGTGVNGITASGTGVKGQSSRDGVGGVFSTTTIQAGDAPPGRGGVFGSTAGAAQVHLVPHPVGAVGPTQTVNAGAFTTKGLEALFPANGKAGDLLYTTPAGQTGAPGALWLCTISGTDKRNPAWWQQVLLGPIFTGLG